MSGMSALQDRKAFTGPGGTGSYRMTGMSALQDRKAFTGSGEQEVIG